MRQFRNSESTSYKKCRQEKDAQAKAIKKKSFHCPGSDSNADREVKLATQANLKKTYRAGLI